MAICTAPRSSITARPSVRTEKSAIRFSAAAAATITDRQRRRGWAGPTMA